MIKVAIPIIDDDEINAVAKVLRSGRYVSGPSVKEFEDRFAAYIGTKYAVMVSSGTAALYITMQALGIGPGDEVIVPAMTFFSTITAVLRCGATPIFADIDPEIYNLDPCSMEEKITDRTKAIIPVHLYGHPADMDKIDDVIGEDIFVIEDAAQAHGAEYKRWRCGSLGDAGCWSFYATKNMTTATEGGGITTDNEELAEKARIIRSHGMTDRNTHSVLGYNDRMCELGGAIGLVQLRKLDRLNEARAENCIYLTRHLKEFNIPWLGLPVVKSWAKHAWFCYPIRVYTEELGMTGWELRTLLGERGIEARYRYNEPLYKQPVLEQFSHLHDYSKDYCPNAEAISGNMLGLPNHPELTLTDLETIVEVISTI